MSLSDQDLRTIRELADRFKDVMVNRNMDAVASVYTDDAVIMPPGRGSVTGRSDIKSFLGGFPPISAFENTVDDVDGRDDMAFVRGHFRMVITGEAGAEPVEETGQYLEIRKKQPDGSWPIAIDIFNPGI